MNVYKCLLVCLLGIFGLVGLPSSGGCAPPSGKGAESRSGAGAATVVSGSKESSGSLFPCHRLEKELRAHRQEVSRELRQVKRELARLRAELAEPGIREIMAGIGYILGLFGIAAFVLSRRGTR